GLRNGLAIDLREGDAQRIVDSAGAPGQDVDELLGLGDTAQAEAQCGRKQESADALLHWCSCGWVVLVLVVGLSQGSGEEPAPRRLPRSPFARVARIRGRAAPCQSGASEAASGLRSKAIRPVTEGPRGAPGRPLPGIGFRPQVLVLGMPADPGVD